MNHLGDDTNVTLPTSTLVVIVFTISIIMQTMFFIVQPTDWLIWQALGMLAGTNIAAVTTAILLNSKASKIQENEDGVIQFSRKVSKAMAERNIDEAQMDKAMNRLLDMAFPVKDELMPPMERDDDFEL